MCEITVVKGEIFSSEYKIQNNCKQTIFQFMTREVLVKTKPINKTLPQKVTKQSKKKIMSKVGEQRQTLKIKAKDLGMLCKFSMS